MQTAERFNHINVIYPIANGEDVLFGRHANDQIPKFMGVAREYEFSPNDIYYQAARNFWNIVIKDHTLAIGGIVVMSVLAYRVKKASGWTILRQKLVIHITC